MREHRKSSATFEVRLQDKVSCFPGNLCDGLGAVAAEEEDDACEHAPDGVDAAVDLVGGQVGDSFEDAGGDGLAGGFPGLEGDPSSTWPVEYLAGRSLRS